MAKNKEANKKNIRVYYWPKYGVWAIDEKQAKRIAKKKNKNKVVKIIKK